MPRTPLGGLARHEGFQIAGHQSLHDRMLRTERLQNHPPRRFRPPRSAGHLMQQLKPVQFRIKKLSKLQDGLSVSVIRSLTWLCCYQMTLQTMFSANLVKGFISVFE